MSGSFRETASLFQQLSSLVKAGVPLHQGLQHLAASQPPRLRKICREIADSLQHGRPLHQACRTHAHRLFSETQLLCLEAAEESGQLESMLQSLAAEAEQRHQLQQRLLTRLAYPVLLIHLAAVIPSIITLVQQSALHALLEILLWLAPFYLLALLLWLLTHHGRADRWLLRLPFLGNFLRCQGAARTCLTLLIMMRAGARMEKAWVVASHASGNLHMQRALLAQTPALERGESLSKLMRASGVFPESVTSLLAAGELSGSLDLSLNQCVALLSEDAKTSLDRLGLALPALAFAVAVLMILSRILLTLSPLLSLYQQMDSL
ncbi:MAG: hypothetical protein HC904_14255 [Blastochloris sp.]|nr:hypothetical protein [Blastochloris sp.]